MPSETVNSTQVLDALTALRQELARLSERVAALEAAAGGRPRPAAPVSPPVLEAEGLSEELVLVIGAAVAAFLGKKGHVRQIRLAGTTSWAQQGRMTIQASHALSVRHS